MIDYTDKSALNSYVGKRENALNTLKKGRNHKDTFKTNLMDTNFKKDDKSQGQQLLKQGYKLLFRDGNKIAVKGKKEIVL